MLNEQNSMTPGIALMVTRRCNMSCGHCSVASSPSVKDSTSEETLRQMIEDTALAGIPWIQFTGGEPTLDHDLLVRLLRHARKYNLQTAVVSNGFWGADTLENVIRILRQFRSAGLSQLTISYDTFHDEFHGIDPILTIAEACEEIGFGLQINLTRLKSDEALSPLISSISRFSQVDLRFYDIQPVGRAKGLPGSELRSETRGFCNACERPAITDDGRLIACNGPSYFSKDDSPLVVGRLNQSTLPELLEKHRNDPILETIRTFGPTRLLEEIRNIPELDFVPRQQYNGICDLCLHINSHQEAVAAIYQALETEEKIAERLAARILIEQKRRHGSMNMPFVNSAGITSLILDVSLARRSRKEIPLNIVRRTDLDWARTLQQISLNGLASPTLSFFEDATVKAICPSYFQQGIQDASLREAIRMNVTRAAFEEIREALKIARIENAIVLKGGALILESWKIGKDQPCKALGDIDLFVPPDKALSLRNLLLERGFTGDAQSSFDPGFQHLDPISFKGLDLEIHTRIADKTWNLPEEAMIAHTVPVPHWEPLRIMEPEAFLIHLTTHLSTECYHRGLKTAWGVAWILKTQGESIQWTKVLRWVNMLRFPRTFWIPIQILSEDLDISFPAQVLDSIPRDQRQERIMTIARSRFYKTSDTRASAIHVHRLRHDLLLSDSFSALLAILRRELGPHAMKKRLQYLRRIGLKNYLATQSKVSSSEREGLTKDQKPPR